ncbi:FtsX-like permease family protein [Paenibacillus nasutitermitis]|uniref:Efflux ABC transporter permease n=1 Tax=Paenibacillus nasutitermitis TaxID=1652958 RepID=A0A917DUJ4_9BACL|nr:ABC transporter permease [Paenibacillus nasutitermitis]GGD72387.1 efflux ABC transporter permease [Paenibacillus nasutitermitis]
MMMFPNSNKGIIKKLIRRSLRANRTRNRYVILAVILTTWLLTSVFTIGMSFMKTFDMQQIRMIGTTADVALYNPSQEQIERLKQLPYVSHVGLDTQVAQVIPTQEMGDLEVSMHGYDASEWDNMRAPLLGNKVNAYPEKRNEVIVPTWILDKLNITEPAIGMTLPLTYQSEAGERKESFILSGWYTDYSQLRSGNAGVIIVSREFAESVGADSSGKSTVASIAFKGGSSIDQNMSQLEQDLKLNEDQKLTSYSTIEDQNSSKMTTMLGIAGIIVFVMFSGYLLIYNVLYISVATDTKFYGLLKTIGMTRKQIIRMVNGQAVRLAGIGIPIGVAAGVITSLVAVPLAIEAFTLDTDVEISFHPIIYAGAVLFAWLTTMAGCRKPARIAAKISPVEAAKYVRTTTKKSRHGSKLYRMALRNMFRDKKRALTVFLSLFIGLTTFLTINTLVLSMNTDNFIASYIDNDFDLMNKTVDFGYQGEQKQKLTEEMAEAVQQMSGVTDVRKTYIDKEGSIGYTNEVFGKYVDDRVTRYNMERPTDEQLKDSGMFWSVLIGIDTKYVTEMNKSLETPIDVERFEKGEIALLSSSEEVVNRGDRFQFNFKEGGVDRELEIGGFVSPQFQVSFGGMAPNVYVSHNAMKQIIKDPILYKMNIQANKKDQPRIQEQLETLIAGDREIELTSKLQWAEKLESAKIIFYLLGGAITLILAAIGILNFISTMFTSVVVRKHEFAVMESIGMTRRQLRKMLLLEGMGYAVISTLLISSLGTLISYGAYHVFSQEADYAIYTFPTIPLLIAFVLVFASCLSVPIIAYNRSKKMSIVERLREAV